MTTLRHDQVRRRLHLGRDRLNTVERAALDQHLADCPDCQSYMSELASLQAQLTRVLRARWGAGRSASSQRTLRLRLRHQARRQRARTLGASIAYGVAFVAMIVAVVWALNMPRSSLDDQSKVSLAPHIVNPIPAPATGWPGPIAFGDRVKLVGFDLASADLVPGSAVDLTLRWRTDYPIDNGYLVFEQIVDETGQVVAQLDALPANGVRPAQTWQPGEVIVDHHVLMLPITATPGEYSLIVGMYDGFYNARQKTSLGGDALRLARLNVRPIPNRVDVPLDRFAALLGYSVETTDMKPNAGLAVTLYWQARSGTATSYKSFIHLVNVADPTGTPIAISDSIPAKGQRPTPTWQWGETIPDLHDLRMPPDLPAGVYNLMAGLYDSNTGSRLSTPDGNGLITLTSIEVK
jgi:hypothetical protein